LLKPDWNYSNVNISSTLAEFLGVENKNTTLPILKQELDKEYKNVVFICFDGLGIYPLRQNLEEYDLFVRETKQVLYSTFPSTTTNATTSLLTNTFPLEHGWFGWSLHFKNINRNIDIYTHNDSWTGQKVDMSKVELKRPQYYFDKESSGEYEINTVFPPYVVVENKDRNNVYSNNKDFFDKIIKVCKKSGKQFCYAYNQEPDHTMHDCGVTCEESKKLIKLLQDGVQRLIEETEDTLFIITADHGQIDVTGYVEFYKDKKLLDMLKIYPYLDSRAPAFIVKEGKEKEFEKYFSSKYGKDFLLYKSDYLVDNGYFGTIGDKREYLGDYIAIGYTYNQGLLTEKSHRFKGHHTSLTEEMEVPLILVNSRKNNRDKY
ncbi:MAG: alkaline phosphatase family protein, partial [Clostridia bacterium]|nr:alkaline phosphatase family protein [Clostridia bacterium]